MHKVTIDGVDYERDQLSEEGQYQLDLLLMTDQMIRQLQAEVAMMQTARQAYANALKASLVTMSAPTLGELIE
jgi:hypothetical protein